MSLTLLQITMRIAMPCAIVAVGVAGLLIALRFVAWME
jgi:hypothetical protein